MASSKVTRRTFVKFSLGLLAVPVLQACAPAAPAATPVPQIVKETVIHEVTAVPQPGGKIGGSVSVLGVWGGVELDSFMAMIKPFEDQTGVVVQFEGTRDLNATLTTRLQGGNPPDVAGLPGPGQMAEYARAGKLVDLSGVLDMAAMQQQYAGDWIKLGQVDGKQVGIFIKVALKGPIWYNPKAFAAAGYTVPKTWDETMALSQTIADTGVTPWSVGLESGAASGWPATDWLEDIVLRQCGPDVYDQWYQGKIKWTSPEIKKAWQTWGLIVADPKMVFGGKQGVLATNFGDAANPLFTTPPQAYLHHQASFITANIVSAYPDLVAVDDYNFFIFPDVDPKYAGAVEGAGDLFGMFKDTPQARALMQYLTTPEAQAIWVKRGGALSANKLMAADAYPDQLSKQMGDLLTGAKIVRFDASDLMPAAMNDAFWKATLDYVNNPADLDNILARLDGIQADAYK